jgi:hypothetical protein
MSDFDFSELDKLAVDIGTASGEVVGNVVKAVKVTSHNVKKDWQEPLQGSSTLPALARAVSYDVTVRATGVEGEVGFDKDKPQGPLGNISEFGSPTSPPRGFGLAALEKNQDDFVRGIEIATDDTLKDVGL